jgi:hypothetical protein
MRVTGLTLGNIPPLDVPFRFFLTAPWFGVMAALLLIYNGPEAWINGQYTVLIGITHLLTLGFVTMVMLGALFQLLPALSGKSIPAQKPVAQIVHLFLVAGVLCLSSGFIFHELALLPLSVVFLAFSICCFIAVTGGRLATMTGGGDSIPALRLALVSLLVTTGLGIYRALGYVYDFESYPDLAVTHLSWGLLGWVVTLIMSISFQVIPMFHITPDYPGGLVRVIPGVLFAGLLIGSITTASVVINGLVIVMGAAVLVYAGFSLSLLQHRKHKLPDITVHFWKLGMVNLILAVLVFIPVFYLPGFNDSGVISSKGWILVGILIIPGFACSIILGMLQKIVPFLVYLHLQRTCLRNIDAIKSLPGMHMIISTDHSKWLFRFHITAILAMISAVLYGPLTRIAALLLLLDFGWLAFLVTSAALLYTGNRDRIATMETVVIEQDLINPKSERLPENRTTSP